MTREEAISNHRKMWTWLSENPEKEKKDYLQEFDLEAHLISDCYLCEYTNDKSCRECPIEWPTWACFCGDGLYHKWQLVKDNLDYILAAEIAKQIAELPEKEETK